MCVCGHQILKAEYINIHIPTACLHGILRYVGRKRYIFCIDILRFCAISDDVGKKASSTENIRLAFLTGLVG